ncbi:chemotaxis protein CheW [Haloferax volcanii]|uniref:Purine-binding chemotaxis protein CheW n=2 Tax=Haloferax volcanii TaxID=2246 RepID=A0A384KMI4_HALVD|nr:purine-binding chemotaxis protein CheW [Haloferax volcanii DS2]MBS8120459.1 chemotaxis protein CheW [Haloferax volcanii]MBS8125496.1 chemotaxis protein CheW [Haloferax volcanii]MBS8129363.1 chemotaxis protein CheW [Haloferax volcanii]MBS8133228.1 chemotaxis protein CheW [Haloferax volcanii]
MSLTDAPDGALAEPTQVLEFELGEERYCVVLDAVTEIIDRTSARSLPDSPPHVVGAMDYRGATTEPTAPYFLERSREPLGR